MKKYIILIFIMFVTGCSRITFVQYEQPGDQPVIKKWHHTTLNGLVEISKPLDLEHICDGKAWNQVTTEYSFVNGLVAAFVPNIGALSFYNPWTNVVECYQVEVVDEALDEAV